MTESYQSQAPAASGSGRFYKLPADVARRDDLTPADKLLYAVVVDRIGLAALAGRGEVCRAGIRPLAADTSLDLATVGACLGRLERRGLLAVERRGSGRFNLYRLSPESARKNQAPEKTKRLKKARASARKNRAQAHGISERTIDTDLQTVGAAAPPAPAQGQTPGAGPPPDRPGQVEAPPPARTDGKAELGQLVALWAKGYKTRLGQSLPDAERGRVLGVLKALQQSFDAPRLMAAVGRWFGADRPDYGAGLFKIRLEGGAADLTGRKLPGRAGYTPAPPGQSAAGLVQRFDESEEARP